MVESIGNPAGIGQGTGLGLRERDGIGLGLSRLRTNKNLNPHISTVKGSRLETHEWVVGYWNLLDKPVLVAVHGSRTATVPVQLKYP